MPFINRFKRIKKSLSSNFWSDFRIVLLVSGLLALAFPPSPGGFFVPVALAIFMHFLIQRPPGEAFRWGYWQGLLLGMFTLYWIGNNTIPGATLTIAVNAFHYALVWWIFRQMYHRLPKAGLVSLPFLWVAFEQLRHYSDLRFNWLSLAYTQTYFLPFIQFIEWTGYLGISFLLVSMGVCLYVVWQKPATWKWVIPVLGLLLLLPTGYGMVRMQQVEKTPYPRMRVAVVQPNVDPYQKWDPAFQDSAFQILKNLTRQVAPAHPRLIVWPETATPFYLRYEYTYLKAVHALVDSLNSYLVTGTPDARYFPKENSYHTYNAAFFFAPNQWNFDYYYKMALVPAAESMPFKKTFPFLRRIDVGGGDFFSGKEFKVFWMHFPRSATQSFRQGRSEKSPSLPNTVGTSVAICYESVFPHLIRQFVSRGANLLLIITNDGWFGNTSGPRQHARYAIFRAVENRRSVARSANTGISLIILPSGRIIRRLGWNKKGTLLADIPICRDTTFYSRHGDWFGYWNMLVSLIILGGILGYSWTRRSGRHNS